ncbi:mechanosensitive ion channel domain-containing protein [Stygiolobus azoricus]|uniref:Mechanosensitive ion channel n=1 Tax=Stygiolobus azoricus TaxID=41675 RepID=A0A650CPF3_9CREN|nr:mechanosensitive ion channel domain-containing protein [Stygiolobus azoricus]QGR19724.1 mechanosensitive ion channel [Stygiolobus azoricus]
MVKDEEITDVKEIRKKIGEATAKLVFYIVLYVVVEAIINNLIFPVLERLSASLPSIPYTSSSTSSSSSTPSLAAYEPYVNVLISLLFGYFIVQAFANVVYWNLRLKYDHPTAASMRSVFRLIGIGALVAAIAGGVAGGAAGVALGGFIGIVIGFASQQVLGQAVAGLFILLARPFRIKDHVNVVGEEGIVEEVTTLFTYLNKPDGTVVLIPNNSIIGNKIYLLPKQKQQQKS